jgi:hypothetical protein
MNERFEVYEQFRRIAHGISKYVQKPCKLQRILNNIDRREYNPEIMLQHLILWVVSDDNTIACDKCVFEKSNRKLRRQRDNWKRRATQGGQNA